MSVSVIVVVTIPDAVAKAPFETAAFNAATVKLSGPSTSKSSSVGSVNVKVPVKRRGKRQTNRRDVAIRHRRSNRHAEPGRVLEILQERFNKVRRLRTRQSARKRDARSTVAVDPTGMIPFAIASV